MIDSKSSFKSHRIASLLAVFSLVLLSACGGNGDDNAVSSGAQGAGGAAAVTQAANQVLHLSMTADPSTIDPQLVSVANEISVARQLSTGLFTYDENLNVVPAIARTVPTIENGGISPDGTVYTIDLKQTNWSDGTPLLAGDFVYSVLRALDPEVASPYAWSFYDIKGAKEYNKSLDVEDGKPAPPASEIEDLRANVGVAAKGDYELVFTLAAPSPTFLNVLANFTAFPVKQTVVEAYGDAWTDPANYLGNGPFVLAEWDRGSHMVLKRNDQWYGPAPTLDSMEISVIADNSVALNAYANGEIDVVKATPASLASGVYSDELVTSPELSTYALFMNGKSKTFEDALVRQAFGSAIDRDAYVNAVLQGAGQPATSWVPPGMPGYNAALGANLSYDASNARDLLAQAGHKDGAGLDEVHFIAIAGDKSNLVAQFVENQLETNLGVKVTFDFYDQGEYFDRLFSGDYDAAIQQWVADWPSPENFLVGLFHTDGGANLVGYSNPQFDKLVDDAALAKTDDSRLKLYDEAQTLLLNQAVISPLYYETSTQYVKPTVLDLIMTGLDGQLKGDLFFWKTKIINPEGK